MRHVLGPTLATLILSLAACDDAGAGGEGGADNDAIPNLAYCRPAMDWEEADATFEQQVLDEVNRVRSQGADCRAGGNFGRAPALSMNGHLRCAARVHGVDMVERDYFDHDNPDGEGPAERVDQTGYDWRAVGENIAAGSPTAQQVVEQWMDSDGHCANIMSTQFREIGVGYVAAPETLYGHYWVQVFGSSAGALP